MSWKASAYIKENSCAPNGSQYQKHEKLLLLVLADYHNQDQGGAWPSISKLAEHTMLSVRRTQEILRSLANRNILRIKPQCADDGGSNTNLYQFNGIDYIDTEPLTQGVRPIASVKQRMRPVAGDATDRTRGVRPIAPKLLKEPLTKEEELASQEELARKAAAQSAESKPEIKKAPKAEKKEPERSIGQKVYFEVFDKLPRIQFTLDLDQAVFDKGESHVKEVLAEWKKRKYNPNNYSGMSDAIYNDFRDRRPEIQPTVKSPPRQQPTRTEQNLQNYQLALKARDGAKKQ